MKVHSGVGVGSDAGVGDGEVLGVTVGNGLSEGVGDVGEVPPHAESRAAVVSAGTARAKRPSLVMRRG